MSYVLDARFLKYGITGVIGMAIDFSVTWLCKEKLRFNKYVSNSLGFCFAVMNNFLLNRYWTFSQNTQPFSNQMAKFILVSVTGLAINNILLYFLVNKAKKNFYLLKLVVIALVFFWNFIANSLFTFNSL
jgi:putative flippase GtrA